MSFFLRLIKISILALFSRRRGLLEPSVISLRVWPNDLDLNLHMNNGRYLSLMDLGRVDVMFHSGAFALWFKRGWQPLVAASTVRHFKSLALFQGFEIRTRILGWDEKWVYFEQRFTRRGELYAATGHDLVPSPPLPDWVLAWLKAERGLIDQLKAERQARP